MKKVLVISGPTATGKTSSAISIAQENHAEIVNFDSLLFYKELNIGVAKPTEEEQRQVLHHFVSCTSVATPYNASFFSQKAAERIQEIHSRGRAVILVGGSGFYLQALLQGMYESPSTPIEVLERSENLYQAEGISPFLNILKEHDPASFRLYHANDHYRIRRAVEHYWAWETKFSEVRSTKDKQDRSHWPMNQLEWDVYHAHLDIPKEKHWDIIQERTRSMLDAGLVDEVKALLENFSGKEKPLQSIGYKEVQKLLSGELKTLEECEGRINISTRQLAKAQRTWFKSREKTNFNSLTDQEKMFEEFTNFLEEV